MDTVKIRQFASEWKKRARERKVLAARKEQDAWKKARTIAEHLRTRYGVSKIYLFGSLAWGGFGERSDIDIAIEGLPDPGGYYRVLDEISDLAFPFSVQLVPLEDAWESLRERVLREGYRFDEKVRTPRRSG